MKKSVINLAGGYMPWRCSADYEFVKRIENDIKILCINEPLFYRRDHAESLSNKNDTSLGSILRKEYNEIVRNYKYNRPKIKIDKVVNEYEEIINTYQKEYSTYKKLVNVDYDTIVCISSFNRLEKVKNILKQIYDQKTTYRYKIIVLDDGSSQNYESLVKNFPEIILLKNEINYGKKLYWKTITKLFNAAKEYSSYTIAQIDDDFILTKNFIDKLLDTFFEIKCKNNKYVAIYYHKPEGYTKNSSRWGLGNNWIDGGGLYDIDFIKSINFSIDPISYKRWGLDSQLSSGVWQLISRKINEKNLLVYSTEKSLAKHDGNMDSKMNPNLRIKQPINTEKFDE